jgi:hypothetical protein
MEFLRLHLPTVKKTFQTESFSQLTSSSQSLSPKLSARYTEDKPKPPVLTIKRNVRSKTSKLKDLDSKPKDHDSKLSDLENSSMSANENTPSTVQTPTNLVRPKRFAIPAVLKKTQEPSARNRSAVLGRSSPSPNTMPRSVFNGREPQFAGPCPLICTNTSPKATYKSLSKLSAQVPRERRKRSSNFVDYYISVLSRR